MQSIPFAPELPEQEPKEMFSTRQLVDGRTEIRINNSSYQLIRACLRKADYALNRNLRAQREGEATLFGRAIHGALEVWYSGDPKARSKPSALCDEYIACLEAGLPPVPHGRCLRCAAAGRFLEIAQPLQHLDSLQARSRRNGLVILDAYFDEYHDDPLVILEDNIGPLCERRVEMVLAEESDSRVVFFGTIDSVMQNVETKHILLMDHKTTSSLGKEFLQKINPSSQVIGYVAAFRRTFPQFDTRTFGINGLQVAKTMQNFMRHYVEITDDMIAEWRISLLDAAYDFWARQQAQGPYPMQMDTSCTAYGGCQYRALCEIAPGLRQNIIEAQYEGSQNA